MIPAERSFWESEIYDQKYDLIVIGAGLTGQSAAYFFKKYYPKSRVLVVDRGFFPIGASTRNAGFACFGSVTEHMADMKIEEESRIIERIRRRFNGLKLLRDTLGDKNIGYREPDAFEIFTDQKIFSNALDHIDLCNQWLIEAAEVDEVYKQTKHNGFSAISIKHEGCLHPGMMMKTIYQMNLDLGVEFRWQAQVEFVDLESGYVSLEDGNEFNSSKVILATNSFTKKLLPEIDIKPGRGFVFVTKPIQNLRWNQNYHYDAGYYYFRGVGNDRLLLGGARSLDIDVETTTEFGANQKIKDHLVTFANEVLQLPEGWEIEKEWSGIMGFTSTKSPIIQKYTDNSVIAAGLSGMGVALGMQLGKEAADLLNA
ncbi:MAG: FAD-dependent oxidoreductase [Gracilimonas sp.]|nr:FAD-dependent oxidoreductase [Gracilimonas sp.]